MSEKNPRSFKRQLAVAAVIGVAEGIADATATSVWMHRSLTHKAYKLKPELEFAARTVIWGTGTRPRVWATVHRSHHEFADKDGDPHSPVLQGRYGVIKLFFKNTPMYSRAARAVEKADVFADDLQPDELDRTSFDDTKRGLKLSLLGHTAISERFGNPSEMGTVSWVFGKAAYIIAGNLVNAFGHAGANVKDAIVKGEITSHPDGSYGADSRIVGALTMGEGNQKYHHEHPGDVFFGPDSEQLSWPQKALRDLGGTAALAFIRVGWAELGEEPPIAA